MSGVKRWDYGYTDDGFGGARYLGLIEKPDGKLVHASDYDRDTQELRRDNAQLQFALEQETAAYIKLESERDELRAKVEAMRACGWVRAADQEMICSHIGVASKGDSYELAREKLASLIEWNVQVATDPSVNGGKMLVPIDLLCKVVRGDPSLGANARLLVDAWGAMAEIRTMISGAPSAALQAKP